MYGITYIWLNFMVNVGKYTIHGSYGKLHVTFVFFQHKIIFFPTHEPTPLSQRNLGQAFPSIPHGIVEGTD